MKKSKLLVLAVALIACMTLTFLVACDEETPAVTVCEHTYGDYSLISQPTATATGTAIRVCSKCQVAETIEVAALTDTSVWTAVTTNATHSAPGKIEYTSDAFGKVTIAVDRLAACVYDKEVVDERYLKNAATCTDSAVYYKTCSCGSVGTETFVYGDALGHTEVIDEETESTCTVAGLTEGKHCSVCGVITKAQEAKPLANHTEVIDEETESTCTVAGLTQGKHCSVCGVITQAQEAKPLANHTEVIDEAHPSTCTVQGVTEGKHCSVCGETIVSQTRLPLVPHIPGPEATCEDDQVCLSCGRVIDAAHHIWSEDYKLVYDTVGGSFEEEGEAQASQYHAKYCTVCGEYDTTSKVEHDFGAEYLVGKKDFNGTDITRWHDCNACEYSEQVDRSLGYLEYVWTLSEEQAADYNNPGYQVYTKEAYRYEMVIPKLVAPYDGKTYYVAGLSVGDTTNKVVNANPYTGVTVTLDENGVGEGKSYPLKGYFRVAMVNPAEGKVLVYVGSNTYNGYVDMESGLIVYATDEYYSNVFILSPIGGIDIEDVKASAWSYDNGAGDAMAITFTVECNLHAAHVLNIYVDDGIYAGVTFVSDTEIEGDACYNTSVTVLDINGDPVKTFVYDGGMFVADGAQGTYAIDLGEGDKEIVLNGHGKFVIASDNIQGVYTIVENAAYDADVYVVVDGNRVAYYQATIAGERINLVKPVANATFANVGAHSDDVISDAELNLNVANALPSVSSKDQYTFVGWCLDSECAGEIYTAYTPVDGTALTFYAKWAEPVNVHIVDAVAGNSDVVTTPGILYENILPDYVAGKTFNGFYVFAGWYADEAFETPFDVEGETVLGEDVYVYAKYTQSGVWNITTGSTYTFAYNAETDTWVSNNKGVKNSDATMEIKAVDGPIEVSFTYWASGEGGRYDILTIWYNDSKDGNAWKSVTAGSKTATIADAKTISTVLRAGDKITFSYKKDGSGDYGSDEAYIIGLKINGMTITHTKTPDLMNGTYTCEGKSDLVLDGFGSFTMGEESGSYVKAAADAEYSAIAYTAEKTYKIVIAGTTYTATEYTVSASYNFGEVTTSLENTTAYYGKEFNLPDAPVVAGYVFRGWFTTSTFDGSAITVATITEDTVFYAKYDVAVTLTYKYLDGVTADAVENKFANDVIEPVKAMDVTVAGKVFIGWFMLDGSESGEWGDQFVDGAVITENTVVYAKWVVPHATAGAYHGCEYDPSESSIVGAAKSNSTVSGNQLTISPEGYVSINISRYNGAKVNYNEDGSFTLTKEGTTGYYNGYYDASGVLVLDYSSDKTEPYYDVYIFTKDELNVQSAYFVSWGKAITKLVRYTMTDDTTMDILYYNGKVYANVTWVAKNAEGGDITDMTTLAANVKSIEITAGENVFLFAKSGNDLYLADGTEGTYTDGSETIVLDGVGGITYNGNTGTYTAAAEDAGYGYDVVIGSATYTLTINVSAKTYTMAENKVTVTYVNDKVAVASESVYRNVEITLYNGADLTVSGYIFRGWFATDTFDGNAITTTTLTDNATFYAKYDAAVTLTFDYNGQGTEAVVVPDKYVGDKVSGIPAVGSDVVTSDGKVFAGWYTQNGTDGEWGEEVTTSTVLTGDATFYAKWIKAVEAYGTYKGFNMYGSKGTSTTSLSMSIITIAANGSFGTGTLTDEQGAVTDGSMVLDGAYYYFNKELGIMWKKDGSSKLATGVGTDTDLGFREDVTSVAYSCWNSVTNSTSLVALITINYANGS
ncbi:MAG: InlB B-repeat-containing protein, partial [Christensenellales bacterium]